MGTSERWRRAALMGGAVLAAVIVSAGQINASTSGQVAMGAQLFQQKGCVECHGADLGGGQGPQLTGSLFMRKYGDFDELRRFIHRNMPLSNPGSLTQEEATNLASYIYNHNGVGPNGFAYPDFERVWTRNDQPVASGTQRSWLWGPHGFDARWEEYAEAAEGRRLVQYFDKTRMEITRVNDRSRPDYVTNGLLATELVTGRLQKGDGAFEQRSPATVNVAGDTDDRQGPTYATFTNLTGGVDPSTGPVAATIDRAGNVGQSAHGGHDIRYAFYSDQTRHNIPDVFWTFLNSRGPVLENGQLTDGPMFADWWGPTGLPITEAYWTTVRVGGVEKEVLVQVFQRRVLTYTPANEPEWRVEMGNVGRHYHAWRYGQ